MGKSKEPVNPDLLNERSKGTFRPQVMGPCIYGSESAAKLKVFSNKGASLSMLHLS